MARRKERVRYEVDPHNRLIVTETGKKGDIPKYRHLIDGRFKIGKKNSLTYHVKKSHDTAIPQQIKFSGNWSLAKDHNLTFTLSKWGNQIAGNKLTIKGKVIDAKNSTLLFALATKTPEGHARVYTIKLSGSWRADKNNRLTFDVGKEKGPHDVLTLRGVWDINPQGKLIYQYTRRNLRAEQKQAHTLTFEGKWDASDKLRLSYAWGKTAITIGGRWKIDAKRGLLFEVEYKKGRIHALIFGGTLKLNKKDNLEVRLRSERGKDLGAKLVLSRRFLKGCGEAFLKAQTSRKETTLGAGVGFIW